MAKSLMKAVSIACADAEALQWERQAKRAGVSVSAWVRKACAEFQILEKMTPAEFEAYYEAGKVLAEFERNAEGKR